MNDATIYCLCLNENNLSVVKKLGYEPVTSINEGIPKFISWYKNYISKQ